MSKNEEIEKKKILKKLVFKRPNTQSIQHIEKEGWKFFGS